jgi:hypothetical protein
MTKGAIAEGAKESKDDDRRKIDLTNSILTTLDG